MRRARLGRVSARRRGRRRAAIVGENTAIKALAALYDKTPLETLKAWQAFNVADQAAPSCRSACRQPVRVHQDADRRDRAAPALAPRRRLIDGSLGELLGQAYVEHYFPPQSKAMMEELVANLKMAMGDRIQGNSWMSPATKKAALRSSPRWT